MPPCATAGYPLRRRVLAGLFGVRLDDVDAVEEMRRNPMEQAGIRDLARLETPSPETRGYASEFPAIELEDPAQRQLLILCLDTSSSMAGYPIALLNQALHEWTTHLREDPSLAHRVEVAVVTFGGRRVTAWQGPHALQERSDVSPFVSAQHFEPPQLVASGVTLMTEAVELATQLIGGP